MCDAAIGRDDHTPVSALTQNSGRILAAHAWPGSNDHGAIALTQGTAAQSCEGCSFVLEFEVASGISENMLPNAIPRHLLHFGNQTAHQSAVFLDRRLLRGIRNLP